MATIFRPPLIFRTWAPDPAGVAIRAQGEFPQNIRPLLAALPAVLSVLFMPVPRADPAGVAVRAQTEVVGSPLVLLTTKAPTPFQTSVTETPRGPRHPVHEVTVFPNLTALTSAAPFPTQFTAYRSPAPDWGAAVRSPEGISNRLPLNAATPLVGRIATDMPVRGLDRGPSIRALTEVAANWRPLIAAGVPFTPVDWTNPQIERSRYPAVTAQDGVTANETPLVAAGVPFVLGDLSGPVVRRVALQPDIEQNQLGLQAPAPVPFPAVDLGLPTGPPPRAQPAAQGTLLPLNTATPVVGRTATDMPVRALGRYAAVGSQDDVRGTVRPQRAEVPLIGRVSLDMPVRGLDRGPAVRAQAEATGTKLPLLSAVPFFPSGQVLPVARRASQQPGETQNRLALTTRPFTPTGISLPVLRRTVLQPEITQSLLGLTAVVPRPFVGMTMQLPPMLPWRLAAISAQTDVTGMPLPIRPVVPPPGSFARVQAIII